MNMKKMIIILMMIFTMTASMFSYIPTADAIKHNTKTSFVIINSQKYTSKKYREITISKYFTLESLINKEWSSLVFHRTVCKYKQPKCVLANIMFVTEDNWKTITKQELYDLTFDFFKANTKLYKNAERKTVYEAKKED